MINHFMNKPELANLTLLTTFFSLFYICVAVASLRKRKDVNWAMVDDSVCSIVKSLSIVVNAGIAFFFSIMVFWWLHLLDIR